ncbi:MAG: tRNA (adenosine(37)-N6)-dimethylallyltransferase MiaA [Hyphomicrobiaceae bacterium]|nr:tRNA (adenosine(37)-N6)-dimethylallyltransferase MiaA [Hyphomicrobiaceae bacterium]
MSRTEAGALQAVLIAGPTASGKSALAVEIAAARNGIVINADSMQVYRELRIVTARPSAGDEALVPHRLYGHVSAARAYSVAAWLDDVRHELAEARRAGRLAVIVGGTGLYFKALLEGLSPVPPIPPEIRSSWRAALAQDGVARLHDELARRDAIMAARLRPSDAQRIVRALEVVEATGRSLAHWQAVAGEGALEAGLTERLVVSPPRAELYARIDRRFQAMIEAGALAEVAALAGLGLPADLPAMRALGVRPLMAHLAGIQSLEQAIAQATAETRRYAKRQLTWLKRNMIAWKWHAAQ